MATWKIEADDECGIGEILVAEVPEVVKVNAPIARLKGEGGAAATPSAPTEAPKAEKAGDPEKTAPEAAEPQPEGEGPAPVTPKVELRDPEIPADARLVKITVRDALQIGRAHVCTPVT